MWNKASHWRLRVQKGGLVLSWPRSGFLNPLEIGFYPRLYVPGWVEGVCRGPLKLLALGDQSRLELWRITGLASLYPSHLMVQWKGREKKAVEPKAGWQRKEQGWWHQGVRLRWRTLGGIWECDSLEKFSLRVGWTDWIQGGLMWNKAETEPKAWLKNASLKIFIVVKEAMKC